MANYPTDFSTGLESFLAQVEHQAYRMARYALWDHDQALDVVQDSMLKLVERYAHKPAAEWPALFFTIVKHCITDARRRRWLVERKQKLLTFFGVIQTDAENENLEAAAPQTPAQHPEAALIAQQQRTRIDAAVSRLPNRQREVFLLREGQALSINETAQILGCSVGTVKQHHFRALQALRAQLAEVNDYD